MKTLTVTLTDAHKYWAHPGLIQIVEQRTRWTEENVKVFLQKSPLVHFNKQTRLDAKRLLEELSGAGFKLHLVQTQDLIKVSLEIPQENLLMDIQTQVKKIRENQLHDIQVQIREISEKISRLENRQEKQSGQKELQDDSVYQWLDEPEEVRPRPVERAAPSFEPLSFQQASAGPSVETDETRRTTEADIGKYWLSKIGIFTLLLGIVFLVSYTSQFLGAWGKLAIGGALGGILAGLGNFLSGKKQYHRWAMSAIGGGWGILYFTVFAAYHVPLVKVIENPLADFILMLAVAAAFIGQALKFQSRILAFMAYFLAYVATVSTSISLYTLAASYLLALSAVLVTKKLGWSWLALLCLVSVYGIHWFWLEPSIYAVQGDFSSPQKIQELLIGPWAGNGWMIYPLIDRTKSLLHLSFLTLYWSLFTCMGLFPRRDRGQEQDALLSTIALVNGLIFVSCAMHHLHLYFPDMKWLFALGMGCLFGALAWREGRLENSILSDIYLVFSVSLFCLIIPMLFDGPVITYGWAAASVSLVWLGIKHQRGLLRALGGIVAASVLFRLFFIDYLERTGAAASVFHVYPFLFIAGCAGAAFYFIHHLYESSPHLSNEERAWGTRASLISATIAFSGAVLMGGPRAVASSFFVFIAAYLLSRGVKKERFLYRCISLVFFSLAVIRFVFIDGRHPFSQFLLEPTVLPRYLFAVLAIGTMLVLGESLRRNKKMGTGYFEALAISAAALLTILASDPWTKAVLSLIWGLNAFAFIAFGFKTKEPVYRWIGLSIFVLVLIRLFAYDLAQLQVFYRILSFMGLGLVFIIVSFAYNYYSKALLSEEKNS